MFYSQLLLSKKGPLGNIWIAAHFSKRLKKELVNQTNIPSSVDKILHNEVPVVTYRILGFLLLGVVRIYCKKVEYLFHDCLGVLTKLGDAPSGKRTRLSIGSLNAPYHTIALPERFELDAFNLGVLENRELSSDPSVRPREEIMLADAWKDEGVRHASFDKYHYEEDPSCSEAHSTAYTPVRDVLSPDFMDMSSSQNKISLDVTVENLYESRFCLEECLEPMTFDEAEELGLSRLSEDLQTNEKQLNHDAGVNAEEEPPTKSVDSGKHTVAEMMSVPEIAFSESRKHQSTKECPASIAVDVTPQSKLQGLYGDEAPEAMTILTPAARERRRVLRKRKCLYDDEVVVPNKMYKHWISDSRNLVCKRRKAPHTAFHAWKAHKISNLPPSFLEPSIPIDVGTLDDFMDLISKKLRKSQQQCQIVPLSPLAHLTSEAPQGVQEVSILDVLEPATPVGSREKGRSPSEDHDLDFCLIDEEINSNYGDIQETLKSSVRTRAVAGYLYRKFVHKKQRQEEEIISMTQISEGKTAKESARLFYEILVLKTGNYIDVRQDSAYDDILVREAPALKQTFGAEAEAGAGALEA